MSDTKTNLKRLFRRKPGISKVHGFCKKAEQEGFLNVAKLF